MVKTFPLATLWLWLLLVLPISGQAALEATLDRSEIRQNETVQLTLTGEFQPSGPLGLFNLNTLDIEAPDTAPLEADFEILDRQQNYRVQIVNNVNESVVTWTYTLLPRRSGQLTIPALQRGSEQTSPLTLSVQPAEDAPGEDARTFVEVVIDPERGFVQQQFLLVVRLYYRDDLIRGELEHPDHPQALFRQLAEQREYSKYHQGQHYRVVERRYAVFPREPGTLVIPALTFQGTFLEPRTGRRIPRRVSSPPRELTVDPIPDAVAAASWLPAELVEIEESWSASPDTLRTGETLTRTLRLRVQGQEAVALPALPAPQLTGLRVYPEPGRDETEDTPEGVIGTRTETRAIVAIDPGLYTLPAIEIPWWDVTTGQPRMARLPARTLRVTGPASSASPAPAIAMPPPVSSSRNSTEDNALSNSSASASASDDRSTATGFWPVLCMVLGLGWLGTALLWRWSARHRKVATGPTSQANDRATRATAVDAQQLVNELRQIARTSPERLASEFPVWLDRVEHTGGLPAATLESLRQRTRPLLNAMQLARYGNGPKSPSGDAPDLADDLLRTVEATLAELAPGARQQPPKAASLVPDPYA